MIKEKRKNEPKISKTLNDDFASNPKGFWL